MIALRDYQDGLRLTRAMPLEERIACSIEAVPSGCWQWRRSLDSNGYGLIRVAGKTQKAHRVVYELEVGPIREGLVLDHVCRNRGCVNPTHLEVVTQQVNILRGEGLAAVQVQRTHCPKGHAYDDVNTIVYGGRRYCGECKRDRRRARYERTGK